MTINYPYEITQGRDPVEAQANELYMHMAWIARALEDMNVDLELDRKKLRDWLMNHCIYYRAVFAALSARIGREGSTQDPDWPRIRPANEVRNMTYGLLGVRKLFWATPAAMITDLSTLNSNALTIINWVNANLPDWKTAPSETTANVEQPDGSVTQILVPVVITFPANLKTQIASMRATFGAVPA